MVVDGFDGFPGELRGERSVWEVFLVCFSRFIGAADYEAVCWWQCERRC